MAGQFTPGPWDALPRANYVHVAGKGHVAKVTNPWNDAAEREANTRLIAAAPELCEALQQFVNGVETHMIDSPADDILANVTRRAKAALTKAGASS